MKMLIPQLLILISLLSLAGCNPNTAYDVMISAAVGDDIEVAGNEDEQIFIHYKVEPREDSIDLSLALASNPSHGNIVCSYPDKTTASCTYTPNKDWHGTDAVYFSTSDGDMKGAKNGKVTISVSSVFDAPVLPEQPSIGMSSNTQRAFSINPAISPETESITYEIVKMPAHGSLSGCIVDKSASINCNFVPNKDFHGSDSIVFKAVGATSGLASAERTLNISVNPIVVDGGNSQSYTLNEDSSVSFVFEVPNPDKSTDLYVQLVTNPKDGTINCKDASTPYQKICVYTPKANWNGTDSIEFKAFDRGFSGAPSTVKFIVLPVNDAPVMGLIPNQVTKEDINLTVDVSISDVDNVLSCSSIKSSLPDNKLISSITFQGTAPSCKANIALVADANGIANITLSISDGQLEAKRIFVLVVEAVNDAPKMVEIPNQSTSENVIKDIPVSISDIDSILTCSSISGVAADPSKISSISFSGAIPNCTARVTPALNTAGATGITFTVNDGSLTASRTFSFTIISALKMDPITNQTTDEDVAFDIPVKITDPSNSQLACSAIKSSLSNAPLISSIVFQGNVPNCVARVTPAKDANGTSSATFTITSGTKSASRDFLITVNPVNDAPEIAGIPNQSTPENIIKDIPVSISDIDSILTCSSISGVAADPSKISSISFSGAIPNCTARVTPALNASGATNLTFTVSDGSLTASRTFSFTIISALKMDPIANQTTDEDVAFDIPVKITDPSNSQLACSAIKSSLSNAPLISSIVFQGNVPNCVARVTPAKDANGTSSATFTIISGTKSASRDFLITVNPVNDAPVAKDEILSMDGDTTLKFNLTATDVDDPITDLVFHVDQNNVPSDSAKIKGTLVCDTAKNYRSCDYTAASGESGRVGFCFQAADPKEAFSNVACIRIDISKQKYNATATFTQRPGGVLEGADILWVVDNSGSMSSSQAALAANFSSFIDNFLVNGKARFKFKMAVTTTDSYLTAKPLLRLDSSGYLYNFSSAKAESDFAAFKADFQAAVNVGTSGSATEKSLLSTHSVLASSNYATWNSGDDHALIVIILSDEYEQTINKSHKGSGSRSETIVDNLTVSGWANYLKTFKSDGNRVKVFPIVKFNQDTNNYYQDLAAAFGTTRSDITQPFDGILNAIGSSVTNLVSSYSLDGSHQVNENSLVVKVNGVVKTKNVDFTFIPSINGINFINVPQPGATITVTYEYTWK